MHSKIVLRKIAAAAANFGNLLSAQGNYSNAILHYTEALRLKPDFLDAENGLGLAQAILGDSLAALFSPIRRAALAAAWGLQAGEIGRELAVMRGHGVVADDLEAQACVEALRGVAFQDKELGRAPLFPGQRQQCAHRNGAVLSSRTGIQLPDCRPTGRNGK